jgi:hypothetical protein
VNGLDAAFALFLPVLRSQVVPLLFLTVLLVLLPVLALIWSGKLVYSISWRSYKTTAKTNGIATSWMKLTFEGLADAAFASIDTRYFIFIFASCLLFLLAGAGHFQALMFA